MAIKNLKRLLAEIAKDGKAGELAPLIAYYSDSIKLKKDKKDLFEHLMTLRQLDAPINLEEIEMTSINDSEINEHIDKDYRLKNLEIANLRGIPSSNDNGKPFGFNLEDESNISNAVVIANNGVGKSSLFAGLEMVYAQEIGEKNLRSKSDNSLEDYNEYLMRFESNNQPICKIQTNSGEFDLKNPLFKSDSELKTFNPSNHFISDYDIYHYGQLDFNGNQNTQNSFHNIIANSLGLTDLMSFKESLLGVKGYNRRKEAKDLRDQESEIREKQKQLSGLKLLIKEIESKQSDKPKENNKKEVSNSWFNNEVNKIKSKPIDDFSAYHIKELRAQFEKAFSDYLTHLTAVNRNTEASFLSLGSEMLEKSDDCPFCESSKLTIEELKSKLQLRLAALSKAEISQNQLIEILRKLNSVILGFFNSLYGLLQEIGKEVVFFEKHKQTKKIYFELAMTFKKYLSVTSDEEMFEFLNKIADKRTFRDTDFTNYINFLNGPVIREYDEILDEIIQFIDKREKKVEAIVLKIKDSGVIGKETNNNEQELSERKIIIANLEREIKTLNKNLPQLKKSSENVTFIQDKLKIYLKVLEKSINSIVVESFEPIKDIVQVIMSDYLEPDGLELTIELTQSDISYVSNNYVDDGYIENDRVNEFIVANVIDKKSGKKISPDLYFNTFRYKLYTLMISLSLALATRKKYKCNLPLVMDDLFSGSDFVSKNSFSEFLMKVINLFYKHTPKMPFQFILFTHDDVIFRSAIDTLYYFKLNDENQNAELCPENKEDIAERTVIARIFDIVQNNSTPSDEPFHNILYKLPKSVLID
jgi:hypothetical protein